MLGSLGKYRLETRLGGGGMAEVFIASTQGAEGFSRRVAIKRVLPGFSDNPSFAGMFVAEAQISSRLVHPNIVSVLDFDRDAENRLFLVMELVEGKDLDGLVSSGLVPYPVVIFVITEVLRGLGYAHDLPSGGDMRGVVHRDVSPHNVLLSWEGAVKVSDFGIAKARSASEATASVFIKGKPAYMSPEQANGQPLDGRSDLFAVGVMLWEMLVGRRLFVGDDTRATLASVLFGQIPRPRSIRGDIPKDLERVVMKLLERDLPARYPTAEAAIHELLECADAPKAGREQLIALLAERFPHEARVRGSIARSRASLPPGGYGSQHASQPGPAAYATPSMSSMMSAQTGTLGPAATIGGGPRKMSTGAKAAIAVAGTIASGAIAFGIVAATRGDAKQDRQASLTSHEAGVPPPAPDAAPAAAVAVIDAAPPVDAAVPVDAGELTVEPVRDAAPTDGPQKDASSPRDGHAVAKRFGRLEITAFPVLTVTMDGKSLGDTPIKKQVPVGKHTLRLRNVEAKRDERITIEVRENQTTSIDRTK